ncbi:potassium transporter Trk [Anoxybacillus gonensis]|uniref:precorrin-2 dehydrogenase n=1 Tax=Anoxybacillus gonensis TaxID=198467 RepID=A0AAW7TIK9_9BACL|nr:MULTISPECIES: NAD(P)-dependent oxidoreductase [Anoxybacillus]AXM88574.1 potassium transporter Trk [Anoxybacillus ayderensis G10]THD15415.1 potassium transporter Trk [Anoxybacillus ayderensis]AKS37301.1 potassium transporter Trk [Anoxybacillus gonensis]KGP61983.1 potassium transporter Trk [Anoxybacillus gonensis]MBW9219126.1 NAD(P)-binding protein [Anoxybacillus sp. ST70]
MFPLFIRMAGKKVVIAGGGQIAYRRLLPLLDEGACITVISPKAIDAIVHLAEQKRITWHARSIEPSDYADAFFIIAATNDPNINEQIATYASPNQLVNVASNHLFGNVHVPAFFSRGKLQIAITTGGASPTLAKQIKKQLEQQFDESIAQHLETLYEQRQKRKEP